MATSMLPRALLAVLLAAEGLEVSSESSAGTWERDVALEQWLEDRPHLTACGLPRRPGTLAWDEFERDFVAASDPVVLQHVAKANRWRAPKEWSDKGPPPFLLTRS